MQNSNIKFTKKILNTLYKVYYITKPSRKIKISHLISYLIVHQNSLGFGVIEVSGAITIVTSYKGLNIC